MSSRTKAASGERGDQAHRERRGLQDVLRRDLPPNNFVGDNEQLVESTKEIPTGAVILGASFVREGDSMPTTRTLSLFIDDEQVGEGQIMTQPGNFSLVGEGLNVGKDPGEPVMDDYSGTSPYAFTGGTIKEAIVDVSGDHYVDLELEALAMMKRE